MTSAGDVVLQLTDVTQDYGGLRPLRVKRFELHAAQMVALVGFDPTAAAVLVNLITGASAPRTGVVRAFGRLTTDIPDSDAWLGALQQFGLLGERTVLLEQLTVEQNLALSFTLEVDPPPRDVRDQVRRLASDLDIAPAMLDQRPGALSPLDLLQVRLGRALALGPRVLLAEHPSATLSRDDAATYARRLSDIVARRGVAALVLTGDRAFADAVSRDVRTLKPATGELVSSVGWRRWLS